MRSADSGIGLAFGFPEDKTYWDFVANDGEGKHKGWRQKRFAHGMRFRAAGNPQAHHHLHTAFGWAGLMKATVVDVSIHPRYGSTLNDGTINNAVSA